jgi:hypothetical protein
VTSKQISHFSSGESCRRLRGLPFSIITSSWSKAPEASQDAVEKRHHLYRKLRRKPLLTDAMERHADRAERRAVQVLHLVKQEQRPGVAGASHRDNAVRSP